MATCFIPGSLVEMHRVPTVESMACGDLDSGRGVVAVADFDSAFDKGGEGR